MSIWPYLTTGLVVLVVLLAWGIHYTAYQDGRLAGLVEADKRNRGCRTIRDQAQNSLVDAALVCIQKLEPSLVAVKHVLGLICNDPAVGYQLGHLTQSYELLCQAVATHSGESVEKVKDRYRPAQYPRAEQPDPNLTPLQIVIAKDLDISPVTALEVIKWARRRQLTIREHDGDGARSAFAAWADSKARRISQHTPAH